MVVIAVPASFILSLLAGLLAGAAVLLVVAGLAPPRPVMPDLGDALARLHRNPGIQAREPAQQPGTAAPDGQGPADKVGGWLMQRFGAFAGPVPYADLDLLEMRPSRYFAYKAAFALIGLLLPPFLGSVASLIGAPWPIGVPVLASVVLGVLGWFYPRAAVQRDARLARERFSRTITAYIDLVVLERLSGAAVATAVADPAAIAGAPLFQRIDEALARQRLERETPWVALRKLSESIHLPELRELADVIEMSGTRSAPIAESLRARARDIRNRYLNIDIERAAAVSQGQIGITAGLLFCFVLFIATPLMLRLI